MWFLFISEDCLTCHVALELLKKRNETGSVTVVSVKFNQEKKIFESFIQNKNTGEAPVLTVPTLFYSKQNLVLTGDDAIEGIINACWKN